jgi:hypothetical protein
MKNKFLALTAIIIGLAFLTKNAEACTNYIITKGAISTQKLSAVSAKITFMTI